MLNQNQREKCNWMLEKQRKTPRIKELLMPAGQLLSVTWAFTFLRSQESRAACETATQYHIKGVPRGPGTTYYLPGLGWGISGLGVVLCLGRGRRVLARCDVFGAKEWKLVTVVSGFQKLNNGLHMTIVF